jgi:hypothetical protein
MKTSVLITSVLAAVILYGLLRRNFYDLTKELIYKPYEA